MFIKYLTCMFLAIIWLQLLNVKLGKVWMSAATFTIKAAVKVKVHEQWTLICTCMELNYRHKCACSMFELNTRENAL